jgi:hypothetical protein
MIGPYHHMYQLLYHRQSFAMTTLNLPLVLVSIMSSFLGCAAETNCYWRDADYSYGS